MLQQGERLAGRYTITGLIGSGAFADVYTALDANRDNATVADQGVAPTNRPHRKPAFSGAFRARTPPYDDGAATSAYRDRD